MEVKEEKRVDIKNEGNLSELYNAAFSADLQKIEKILEGENKLSNNSNEWQENPLRGVILAEHTRVSVAGILLRHFGYELLLKARDPETGNTLLHLAIECKKEKLVIFFLKYLDKLNTEKLDPYTIQCFLDAVNNKHQTALRIAKLNTEKPDPYTRQCFLDAVNNKKQTALHIATEKLLTPVIEQFVLEKQLKINIKDEEGKTVLDVIQDKCDKLCILKTWKTPWKISIMLRTVGAKKGSKVGMYEDEEDVSKKAKPAEALIMNDAAWNVTTNTILLISTLAFSLVFAAIFTVPQTLAPEGGGDNNSTLGISPTKMAIEHLHESLGKNIAFKVFLVSLTLACLVMIFVIALIVLTVTSKYDVRALILCFSWFCLSIMGGSLIVGYLIAIWIYMGYFFTSILIACGIFSALILLLFAYFFDLWKEFWLSLSHLLSLTLLHGFVVTFLLSIFPKRVVKLLLHILPFDDFED